MPLVALYKAARRSRRLKGRPEWQDVLPSGKELQDAYAIAARYVDRFAHAFVDVSHGLLTSDVLQTLRAKLREGTAEEALAAIPWFGVSDETAGAAPWPLLQTRLESAYR